MKLLKKILVKVSFIFIIIEFSLGLPLLLVIYFTYNEKLIFPIIIITFISAIILTLWGDEN